LAILYLLASAGPPAVLAGAAAGEPPGAGSALAGLSEAVESLTRRVHPCVVKVVAMGYSGGESEGGDTGIVNRGQSTGSGAIVSADGLILTNAHVLGGADRAQVLLPADALAGGRPGGGVQTQVAARVLGVDTESDLALLQAPLSGLPFLPLDPAAQVRQGELVLAFGSPRGLEDSVTLGVVSATARQFDPEDPLAYIQTDAPINPGSSGGPLVDGEGRLVGINTLILSESGGSEGLGFAIPAALAAAVADRLKRSGRAMPGEIGLAGRSNGPGLALALRLPTQVGVVVQDVDPDGPAQRAGLRPGDILDTLDGAPLPGLPQLHLALYRAAPGATLRLGVLREGERREAQVRVGEGTPAAARVAGAVAAANLVPQLGVFAIDMDETLAVELAQSRGRGGVLVAAELDRSPAMGEALQLDDIVYRLNRERVGSAAQLRQLLDRLTPGDPIAFQVERQGRLRYVVMELAQP
jgi:serine protease Do